MGAKRSAWIQKAFAILESRGPTPKKVVISECALVVPPGQGFRVAERNLKDVRKRRGYVEGEGPAPVERPPEDVAYSGQKRIVMQAIAGMIRTQKLIERDGLLMLPWQANGSEPPAKQGSSTPPESDTPRDEGHGRRRHRHRKTIHRDEIAVCRQADVRLRAIANLVEEGVEKHERNQVAAELRNIARRLDRIAQRAMGS